MQHVAVLFVLIFFSPCFMSPSMAAEEPLYADTLKIRNLLHTINTTSDSDEKKGSLKELSDILDQATPPTLDINIQNTMIQALFDSDRDVQRFALSILSYSSDLSIIPYLQDLTNIPSFEQTGTINAIEESHRYQPPPRSFEALKADIFLSSDNLADKAINALKTLYKFYKNDSRTVDTLMQIARGQIYDKRLQIYAIANFSAYGLKEYESELYQISRFLLFNKNFSSASRYQMLEFILKSPYRRKNDFSDFFKIINDPTESFSVRCSVIWTAIDLYEQYPFEIIEFLEILKNKFESEGEISLVKELRKAVEDLEERKREKETELLREREDSAKKEVAPYLVEAPLQIEKTAEDVEIIANLAKSKNNSLTIQKPEDTSEIYSKAKEIERQLRNALERFEIDTQVYEVAVEPIEKDILQLKNEINGPFPLTLTGTLKRGAIAVAEVFGCNDFGTHESLRRKIEKKKFELWKKKREILDPAIEELKTVYNEGVQFFNSYPSVRENKFSPIYSNKLELLEKSQKMLSEFSKLQPK